MLINERQKLALILQASADALDIPDFVYEDATIKYGEVGDHLAADDSDLLSLAPQVYVQGSFRLGTVVQPYGREGDFDIDLVCRLDLKRGSVSQEDLKARVGERLKKREDLAKILRSSRRCWVLDYPSSSGMPAFHMDVLPCIPNDRQGGDGILLTDTQLRRWQESNPIAYAEWFKKQMEVRFLAKRAAVAESLGASIEDVPDWSVKTPLQRCIQILKRHRDICFHKSPELKPVSIIITTLAAQSYRNEEDIFDALTGIASRMPNHIERRNDKWWVANPVEGGENFADKWNYYPERQKAFVDWLVRVGQDLKDVSMAETVTEGVRKLYRPLGQRTMDKVAADLGVSGEALAARVGSSPAMVPSLGDFRHAVSPATQFQIQLAPEYFAKISAGVFFKRGDSRGRFLWPVGDESVPKNVWVRFKVKTDVPMPHSIRWQIVNTGNEAHLDSQPRGEICGGNDSEEYVRWESTAYRGTHWVEAFVLNSNGICRARTGRFLVKVR